MDERSKWGFWAAAVGVFLLICVPSAYFIDALARYRLYVDDVSATGLRPVRMHLVPHRDGLRGVQSKAPDDFADFSLIDRGAKTVALSGDFNGWSQAGLPLAKGADGRWQIVLPLAKGRHGYVFIVDGKPELDPSNKTSADFGGRKASVRVVR